MSKYANLHIFAERNNYLIFKKVGLVLNKIKIKSTKSVDIKLTERENRIKAYLDKKSIEPMSKQEVKESRMNAYSPII